MLFGYVTVTDRVMGHFRTVYSRVRVVLLCSVAVVFILFVQQNVFTGLKKTPKLMTGYRPYPTPDSEIHETVNMTNASSKTAINMINLQCRPTTRIVYIKIPKTGSGTIISIFNRYGISRQLLYAVPKTGPITEYPLSKYIYKYNDIITRYGGFDMMVQHAKYKRRELELLVPNATYIASLREPVSHFESAFAYFKISNTLRSPNNNPMEAFFKEKPFKPRKLMDNFQLLYLGQAPIKNDSDSFRNLFKRLDTEIQLFIIKEYLVESLVLMKNILCWELQDIMFISTHIRMDSYHGRKEDINKVRKQIEEYNYADIKLYQYYNRTLWEKIAAEDQERFWQDVEGVRKGLLELEEKCVTGTERHEKSVMMDYVGPKDKNSSKFCKAFLRQVGPNPGGDIERKKLQINQILSSKILTKTGTKTRIQQYHASNLN